MSSISERLQAVEGRIAKALASRKSEIEQSGSVCLIAVSKNHAVDVVEAALKVGITVFGENRVQEALPKIEHIGAKAQWHLIGHLQTNKAKQIVGKVALVHSVDSERLLQQIEQEAAKQEIYQDVLLQVNVSGEESKFGMEPDAVWTLSRQAAQWPHVRIKGLMTIAPFADDVESVRPVFREAYRLFTALRAAALPQCEWQWLSMGMSNDFEVAIQEGANMVRVGTALFGARQYAPKEEG
nr:YggS family pyridoxal phosphate-dependent enzyme [uncultured Anaeromusa sp.]